MVYAARRWWLERELARVFKDHPDVATELSEVMREYNCMLAEHTEDMELEDFVEMLYHVGLGLRQQARQHVG